MAYHEPYTARDGYSGFSACNTAMDPLRLSGGMFAKGINISVRGGLASTRPGFVDLGSAGSGVFQGAKVFSLEEADHLVFVLSGKVYVWASPFTSPPMLISGAELLGSGMVYFTQVYRWMVCQDGASRPVVIEESGGAFSRVARDAVSDPDSAVPRICLVPGTVGAYAHGRYHYSPTVLPDVNPPLLLNEAQTEYLNLDVLPALTEESGRASIVSSDVLDNLDPYTVFRLSEQRVLAEGGAFSLPGELGFIHGMGSLRGAATGTGVGALFAFGTRGVAAFDFSSPRDGWKNVGISQVAFTGGGTRSPRSIVNVNDDLWYLGTDGHLRSVNYDGAQLSGGGNAASALANTVKSIEASRWVSLATPAWLPSASVCAADNRLHFTVADGRAVGSVELAQAYDANPSELPILHEGVWTGFDFLQVLSINGVLHAFVQAPGRVRLVKLGTGGADPAGTSVASELVTRMFDFVYNEASAYHELKRLVSAQLFLSGIDRPTTVTVEYRPENTPVWTHLGTAAINVPAGSAPQFRRLVFAPDTTVVGECNPVTKQPPWMFHSAQFRIRWTGRATIARFIAEASIQEQTQQPMCQDDNPDNELLPVAADNDFEYSVPLGGLT